MCPLSNEAGDDRVPDGARCRHELRAEVARCRWIAIKMLVGDKAKFLGIVMGLTFAALLITQQGSIFCGLMLRTCGRSPTSRGPTSG